MINPLHYHQIARWSQHFHKFYCQTTFTFVIFVIFWWYFSLFYLKISHIWILKCPGVQMDPSVTSGSEQRKEEEVEQAATLTTEQRISLSLSHSFSLPHSFSLSHSFSLFVCVRACVHALKSKVWQNKVIRYFSDRMSVITLAGCRRRMLLTGYFDP